LTFFKDTGFGIEEHIISTLFKPFAQLMNSEDKMNFGCGVGLTCS
jgi:signal transduction histidine kinase